MKLVKSNFEATKRKAVDAWLDKDQVKLREI